MIMKIDIAKLINLFFKKIVLRFNISADIVNDKNFLFINVFELTFYYHSKIKR